jgi:hypothetical protein
LFGATIFDIRYNSDSEAELQKATTGRSLLPVYLTLHLLVTLVEDKIRGTIFYTDQGRLIWGVKSRVTNGWINRLPVTVPYLRHESVTDLRIRIRIHVKRQGSGTLTEYKQAHVEQPATLSIPLTSWWKANRTVSMNYPGPRDNSSSIIVPYSWFLDLVTNALDILRGSVVDLHHLDADPDADPDSTYPPDADKGVGPNPDIYLMRMRIRIRIHRSRLPKLCGSGSATLLLGLVTLSPSPPRSSCCAAAGPWIWLPLPRIWCWVRHPRPHLLLRPLLNKI